MTTQSRISDVLDIVNSIDPSDVSLRSSIVKLHTATGLSQADINAKVGFLLATPLAFAGDRFDLEIRGIDPEPAFVVKALDAQQRRIDLVAWPIGRPHQLATLHGTAIFLGEADVDAHWPSPMAEPLRVYQTAEAWLCAKCVGCVPICQRRAAQVIIDIGAAILADDDEHGAKLYAARQALFDGGAILVREEA